MNNFLSRLLSILTALAAIPWTIFWILFAVIAAPIQILYHRSSAGKKLRSDFETRHADQYFKRAIALIELHKIRFGEYPDTLKEEGFSEFMGDWDKFIYRAIIYSKIGDGYELNLNSQESLHREYPEAFWSGLGIVKTNVKGLYGSSLE